MTVASIQGAAKPSTRWLRLFLIGLVVVAAGYLVWKIWDREAVVAWMRGANPVWFFLTTALLPVFGAPITPFFVLAGATFGVRLGLLGSVAALGLNLSICYWIARTGLRRWIVSLLRRFKYELPNFQERRALRFTIIVKLAPGVPAFIKNYALGAARVPFPLYLAAGMLVTGTYATLLVVLGESLLAHNLRKLLVVGAVFVVLAGVVWWWRKRRKSAA
jgi:uncharacterized membrane protein YdjX (TVP38/TMEM64 family)